MSGQTVLISPLSWGFGHAGRMIPLALELNRRGCRVIFAADAQLLKLAEKELKGVTLIEIPGLRIRYSRYLPQYFSIAMQLPHLVISAIREHRVLRRLAVEFKPSVIISDNRFGFYNREIFSAYITHQIRIPFPALLRFAEPLAAWIHRAVINRYDLCLVPDYTGSENLTGRLSHGKRLPDNIFYMGPISRFAFSRSEGETGPVPRPFICLILSGPEPQRSLFLEKVMAALGPVLVQEMDRLPEQAFSEAAGQSPSFHEVTGSPGKAFRESASGIPGKMHLVILSATPVTLPVQKSLPRASLIIAPDTATMRRMITSSSLVITRSGYTSVMELVSLGRGAVLVPTPGQTEQEYLGGYLNGRYGFITLEQKRLGQLPEIVANHSDHPQDIPAGNDKLAKDHPPAVQRGKDTVSTASAALTQASQEEENTFADALFEKAINLLLEKKK